MRRCVSSHQHRPWLHKIGRSGLRTQVLHGRDGCRRAGLYKAPHLPFAHPLLVSEVEVECLFVSSLFFSNTSWKGVCDNEKTKSFFLGPTCTLVSHSEVAQTQVLFRIGVKSVIAKRATERYHPVLHPDVTIDVFPYDRPLTDQASPVPVALLDNFNHSRVFWPVSSLNVRRRYRPSFDHTWCRHECTPLYLPFLYFVRATPSRSPDLHNWGNRAYRSH